MFYVCNDCLGRTLLVSEKYAVSLSFSGQPFRLHLRKDNLEFDLDVVTSMTMCFVHSKASLTVTPRYLASLPLQVPARTTHIGRGWGFAFWLLS